MRNLLIVISGPSGVGKGTIAKKLLKESDDFALSISCTTRKPRKGETDGKEYFFITKEEFEKKIEENGLLEYSNHFENYYGTPKDYVLDKLKTKDVILEIDVNGGLKVKENFKDTILIMILPPSLEDVERRLRRRNTETEEKIKLRMSRIKYELEKQALYDYAVVNDDLGEAVEKIKKIILEERNKD